MPALQARLPRTFVPCAQPSATEQRRCRLSLLCWPLCDMKVERDNHDPDGPDPGHPAGRGCAVAVAAARLKIPPAILLVLTGVALALVPGLPEVNLAPELVLLLVLPPVIYSSAVAMSWREFRFNLRPIFAAGGRIGRVHHGRGGGGNTLVAGIAMASWFRARRHCFAPRRTRAAVRRAQNAAPQAHPGGA